MRGARFVPVSATDGILVPESGNSFNIAEVAYKDVRNFVGLRRKSDYILALMMEREKFLSRFEGDII